MKDNEVNPGHATEEEWMATSATIGGPAFPINDFLGMSLRDWFAGQAMKGMLSCPGFADDVCQLPSIHSQQEAIDHIAKLAFSQADSMLKNR